MKFGWPTKRVKDIKKLRYFFRHIDTLYIVTYNLGYYDCQDVHTVNMTM